jgi:hypothetical protein
MARFWDAAGGVELGAANEVTIARLTITTVKRNLMRILLSHLGEAVIMPLWVMVVNPPRVFRVG